MSRLWRTGSDDLHHPHRVAAGHPYPRSGGLPVSPPDTSSLDPALISDSFIPE